MLVLLEEMRPMDESLNSGGYISCEFATTSDLLADKLIGKGYNFKKLVLDTYALAFEAVTDREAVSVLSETGFTGPYLSKNQVISAELKEIGKVGVWRPMRSL
jgi:hypothetical protein